MVREGALPQAWGWRRGRPAPGTGRRRASWPCSGGRSRRQAFPRPAPQTHVPMSVWAPVKGGGELREAPAVHLEELTPWGGRGQAASGRSGPPVQPVPGGAAEGGAGRLSIFPPGSPGAGGEGWPRGSGFAMRASCLREQQVQLRGTRRRPGPFQPPWIFLAGKTGGMSAARSLAPGLGAGAGGGGSVPALDPHGLAGRGVAATVSPGTAAAGLS